MVRGKFRNAIALVKAIVTPARLADAGMTMLEFVNFRRNEFFRVIESVYGRG